MSKSLVIAEKPSVMNDLSRALTKRGEKFTKSKDYLESDNYVVTSAVGHLVEQRKPMTDEGKSLPWNWDHLPVIPEQFQLEPIDGNKGRLNALVRLMKRKDVDKIINACDAGREGELIFRYIVKYSGIEKPMERLWMQSMTDNAILAAFDDLRTDDQMVPLADAAVCRSEADWLVGINATRAMTAFNSKYGGFNKTPVGRVQTPTLALLVEREIEIRDFVPRTFWEVHAEFGVNAGDYAGVWFDPEWKKDPNDKHSKAPTIWNETQAKEIVDRCQGQPGIIEEKKKPSKQHAAPLFDLTSLQRDANGRFGFSARRTLQLAQRLYERHKVATYPRTDSKHLPEDYVEGLRKTFKSFAAAPDTADGVGAFAGQLLENDWLKKIPKVFDDKKITDHHAIIPTGQIPKGLDEAEAKLFRLILQRTIAIFFPPAEFEVTERITRVGKDAFRTNGKILVKPGFLEVYGRTTEAASGDDKDKTLVPVAEGEDAKTEKVEAQKKETRPPARYNEATLLRAMETAGKRVDDDELADAMKERGLGTPATRANIIEGLIKDQYVTRDQRDFIANNRAVRLIQQLGEMKVDILSSPEMTGEWEHKLKQMEEEKFERVVFMDEIRELTREVVTTAKKHSDDELNREYPTFDATCPVCGSSPLGQDEGRYKCTAEDCKFTVPKVLSSRPFVDEEIRTLLSTGHLEKRDGFLSRFRQPFEASLELIEDKTRGKKIEFVFEKSEQDLAEEAAAKTGETLCACPLCKKGEIKVTETAYICTTRVEGGTKACKARLSRNMCKYDIPVEQAKKFFEDGETDEIAEWISKKGRPFTAKLGCNKKGARMLRWVFPPRKKAAKKAAAKKTTKKAATKKTAS